MFQEAGILQSETCSLYIVQQFFPQSLKCWLKELLIHNMAFFFLDKCKDHEIAHFHEEATHSANTFSFSFEKPTGNCVGSNTRKVANMKQKEAILKLGSAALLIIW